MRISLSDAEKSIDFVWIWFEKANAALRARLADERNGAGIPSRSIFLGMTEGELREFFLELEYLSMLDLLSATEAAIRVDFWIRVHERKKDGLSRSFRQVARQFKRKILLDEHVLSAWVAHQPDLKTRTDEFRRILKMRHWLAHGRYWTPKFGRINYSAADAFDICEGLLRKMQLR